MKSVARSHLVRPLPTTLPAFNVYSGNVSPLFAMGKSRSVSGALANQFRSNERAMCLNNNLMFSLAGTLETRAWCI